MDLNNKFPRGRARARALAPVFGVWEVYKAPRVLEINIFLRGGVGFFASTVRVHPNEGSRLLRGTRRSRLKIRSHSRSGNILGSHSGSRVFLECLSRIRLLPTTLYGSCYWSQSQRFGADVTLDVGGLSFECVVQHCGVIVQSICLLLVVCAPVVSSPITQSARRQDCCRSIIENHNLQSLVFV